MSELVVILLFFLALAAICCGGGAPSSPSSPHPLGRCADEVRVVTPKGAGTLACHPEATASVARDADGGATMLCTCPKPGAAVESGESDASEGEAGQ